MLHHFDDRTQQEIWAPVCALNDAWTQGDPEAPYNHFHQQMIATTPTDRLRRDGADRCSRKPRVSPESVTADRVFAAAPASSAGRG